MTVEIADRCDVPCDGLIGAYGWTQRDTMDGVIGEFADAGLLLRSASAALGLDFCSDVFCDPEAVLVHDVSLVFGEIDQPFVGWSQQRRIALIQLG